MRRNDKQMGEDFALDVIDTAEYGVLGLYDNEVYTLPLSIAREGFNLYFHSAMAGKKVDMIKDGDQVSVTFVRNVKVPSIMTREEIIRDIENNYFDDMDTKAFTTEYESAHVKGTIANVQEEGEIVRALKLIAQKFTPEIADLSEELIANGLPITYIYKIEIGEINGKRNKFDKDGKPMRFGRME